jgi:hypothetical protein
MSFFNDIQLFLANHFGIMFIVYVIIFAIVGYFLFFRKEREPQRATSVIRRERINRVEIQRRFTASFSLQNTILNSSLELLPQAKNILSLLFKTCDLYCVIEVKSDEEQENVKKLFEKHGLYQYVQEHVIYSLLISHIISFSFHIHFRD